MNILIIGDVYGDVGKEMISLYLNRIKEDYNIDFLIINGENISKGKGMLLDDYDFLKQYNTDVITMGNHIWFRNDILRYIKSHKEVIKPLNLSRYTPGEGTILLNVRGLKIRVTSVIGRVFMFDFANNQFEAMDDLLEHDTSDIHIVDFHGEATSEKIGFAKNYDGRLTAVYGTHTHVQTSDSRLLPDGTAFICDVGMTGPFDGIIGADQEAVLHKMKTNMPARFVQSNSEGQFNAWVLEISEETKKVTKHHTISITPQKKYEKH